MNSFFEKFKKDFELYIGSFFLSITSIIVIMNVFTRYFLNFTYSWTEEIAVGAFVWTIFLGFANAYKTKNIIGVEILVKMLPARGRVVLEFFTSLIVIVLSGGMFYLSYIYVANSTKITVALEVSYYYIQVSIPIAFGLITIYSIYFSIQSFRKLLASRKKYRKEVK